MNLSSQNTNSNPHDDTSSQDSYMIRTSQFSDNEENVDYKEESKV